MIWFLFGSWISVVVHAILIASLVGTLSGTILGWIPFVRTYGVFIKGISLILLVASIFFEGYIFSQRSYMEKVKEYEQKVQVAEQKAKSANKQIQIKVVEKVKIIKEKSNANKTAITKYVTDTCQLSNAAVLLHDSASQNELPPSTIDTVRGTSDVKVPDLLARVGENYGTCYETREKLKAWQEWYKTQKKIYEDVK